jgi:hypothetical protein
MTLKIRPVKLKQSIYFRVPSDIADLIGLDSNADVTLTLREQDSRFLLIYSVNKLANADPRHSETPYEELSKQLAPLTAVQRSTVSMEAKEKVSNAAEL